MVCRLEAHESWCAGLRLMSLVCRLEAHESRCAGLELEGHVVWLRSYVDCTCTVLKPGFMMCWVEAQVEQ